MKKIFLIFFGWFFVVNILGTFIWNRFDVRIDNAYPWIQTVKVPPSFQIPGKFHMSWDVLWYLGIAEHGYRLVPNQTLQNVVFFPVFPALIKIGSFFTGGNLFLAGWLVSNLSLLCACFVFSKLLRDFHSKVDADYAILFLLLFPTSVFFSTLYTESIFLLMTLSVVYLARKQKLLPTALVGYLAGLTRLTGAFLTPYLILEVWYTSGFRSLFKMKNLYTLTPLLGTLSFFAFHYFKFHNGLIFFEIQKNWGRSTSLHQWDLFLQTSAAIANFGLDSWYLLLGLALTVFVFLRVRKTYAVFMLLTILSAVGTGTLMSIGRYILVLFPSYIALASIKNTTLRTCVLCVSAMIMVITLTLFVNGYWTG